MNSSSRRAVRIERVGRTLFVRYVERKKGQRYNAAQFYCGDGGKTLDEVKTWVNGRPNLVLQEQSAPAVVVVDAPEKSPCCGAYVTCDEHGIPYCKACFEEV